MAIPKRQASFLQEKEWLPPYRQDLTKILLHPYQTHWQLHVKGNLKVTNLTLHWMPKSP